MEKIISLSFEQGGIGSSGNTASDYRVRSEYIRLNPSSFVTVTAVSNVGKDLQAFLLGYDNETSTSPLFDTSEYNLPHTFDILRYSKLRYIRIVLKHKNGSKISPSDVTDCAISLFFDWYVDGLEIKCEGMPIAPKKIMVKPYPTTLWRLDYLSPNIPYIPLFPNIKAINMWSLPRENIIRVYDYREPQDGFKHNGLSILAPSECTSYHELNGRWDINLIHPVDNWGRWKSLLPQNVLKIRGQLFRIDEHTSVSGTSGMYIQVHAKHIFYDLVDELVHHYQGENLNGYEFIRAMFEACMTDADSYDKYNFQYNSDLDSRTGQVEINDKTLLNTLIGSDDCLVNQLNGELYRNNFYFSINKRMESAKNNVFSLKYGFDMTGITQKIDYSDLTTWLMVDDNYGNSFAVSYVNDIYPIHHHKHTFKRFNYPNNDYDRLVKDGQELFGQLCRPKVSYEVNIASMKDNPKYSGFLELQNYSLGDSGTIECDLLDIKTTQKIIAIERDELTGNIKKIKLGSENYSLVRPSYKSDTISTGSTPAEIALQKQVEELGFREYITTPITTNDGLYLMTKDNKYLLYKG